MAEIRIGCQGWNYKDWVAQPGQSSYFDRRGASERQDWQGPFFARGTRSGDFLAEYGKVFDTVEVDSTFYAIPAVNAVRGWFERVPENFIFALKLPQEITHHRRLHHAQEILDPFCERVRLLKHKLGIVLIQLPPDFSPREQAALEKFLPLLPADIKFALEFRDRAWLSSEILALLRQYKVALTLTDSQWLPRQLSFRLIDQPTAPFSYLRWLGPRDLTDFSHVQLDRTEALREWVTACQRLSAHVEMIFAYFNNHWQGHSPFSSIWLKEALGLPVLEPPPSAGQMSLF